LFHAENVFGRQRRHRALHPAGIDWVIRIGSKVLKLTASPCHTCEALSYLRKQVSSTPLFTIHSFQQANFNYCILTPAMYQPMQPADQPFLRRQESSLFVILSATKNLFFITQPPKPDSHPQSLSFRAQPLSFRAQPRNLLNLPPRSTPPISASPFKIRCSIFDIRVSRRPAPLVRPVQLVQPVRFVRPLSISPHPPSKARFRQTPISLINIPVPTDALFLYKGFLCAK